MIGFTKQGALGSNMCTIVGRVACGTLGLLGERGILAGMTSVASHQALMTSASIHSSECSDR